MREVARIEFSVARIEFSYSSRPPLRRQAFPTAERRAGRKQMVQLGFVCNDYEENMQWKKH